MSDPRDQPWGGFDASDGDSGSSADEAPPAAWEGLAASDLGSDEVARSPAAWEHLVQSDAGSDGESVGAEQADQAGELVAVAARVPRDEYGHGLTPDEAIRVGRRPLRQMHIAKLLEPVSRTVQWVVRACQWKGEWPPPLAVGDASAIEGFADVDVEAISAMAVDEPGAGPVVALAEPLPKVVDPEWRGTASMPICNMFRGLDTAVEQAAVIINRVVALQGEKSIMQSGLEEALVLGHLFHGKKTMTSQSTEAASLNTSLWSLGRLRRVSAMSAMLVNVRDVVWMIGNVAPGILADGGR